MTTPTSDTPCGSAAGNTEDSHSVIARLGGALLLVGLVAGFLIATLLCPPAAVAVVIASIAFAACLGRVAWQDVD